MSSKALALKANRNVQKIVQNKNLMKKNPEKDRHVILVFICKKLGRGNILINLKKLPKYKLEN